MIDAQAQPSPLPVPDGLAYLPYQAEGIRFAVERGSVLIADEMGLGKTIQALGVINACPTIRWVLIVCPATLRLNWAAEARKWLVGSPEVRVVENGKTPFAGANVIIINYDRLAQYWDEILRRWWDLIILDEAHYIKNPKSGRGQAVLGRKSRTLAERKAGILSVADRVIMLTGTPILNKPMEIQPLVHALAPAAWNDWLYFARQFCAGHQRNIRLRTGTRIAWDVSGASNLTELNQLLRGSCMIRRMKADVLKDLPPKRRQIIVLPADDVPADLLAAEQRIVQEYGDALLSLPSQPIAFAKIARLREQTAQAKVPHVIAHVQDLLDGGLEKVVVFGHHHSTIAALRDAFGAAAVCCYGETPLAERARAVARFQTEPGVRMFIGSFAAAGTGLTLTAASHVVFAEIDWVPAIMKQAEDRCHRIGQRESVLIQHLVLDGSIDARVARLVVQKQDIEDKALNIGGAK